MDHFYDEEGELITHYKEMHPDYFTKKTPVKIEKDNKENENLIKEIIEKFETKLDSLNEKLDKTKFENENKKPVIQPEKIQKLNIENIPIMNIEKKENLNRKSSKCLIQLNEIINIQGTPRQNIVPNIPEIKEKSVEIPNKIIDLEPENNDPFVKNISVCVPEVKDSAVQKDEKKPSNVKIVYQPKFEKDNSEVGEFLGKISSKIINENVVQEVRKENVECENTGMQTLYFLYNETLCGKIDLSPSIFISGIFYKIKYDK